MKLKNLVIAGVACLALVSFFTISSNDSVAAQNLLSADEMANTMGGCMKCVPLTNGCLTQDGAESCYVTSSLCKGYSRAAGQCAEPRTECQATGGSITCTNVYPSCVNMYTYSYCAYSDSWIYDPGLGWVLVTLCQKDTTRTPVTMSCGSAGATKKWCNIL
ncbi:MAG: hypothetical protein JEZ07_19430 [Phycisphaerae bacterium]|nr:hypothetical protein [Phycisphaerae bacterium]